jgi:hypothetical protein
MGNHYRKGQKVVEWTQVRLGDVGIADALRELVLAEHTYPKYPAPSSDQLSSTHAGR